MCRSRIRDFFWDRSCLPLKPLLLVNVFLLPQPQHNHQIFHLTPGCIMSPWKVSLAALLLLNSWQRSKNKPCGGRQLKCGAIHLSQRIGSVVNKSHIDVSEIFHLPLMDLRNRSICFFHNCREDETSYVWFSQINTHFPILHPAHRHGASANVVCGLYKISSCLYIHLSKFSN